MTDVHASSAAAAAGPTAIAPTVRALIDQRRAAGIRFTLQEVVGALVPACDLVAARHAQGKPTFVSASAITVVDGKVQLLDALLDAAPTLDVDRIAIAPELAAGASSSAKTTDRTSVFAFGAIAYEMLTLRAVGPGMRPPSEINPTLAPSADGVLATALLPDPTHRPGDLRALAQALRQIADALPKTLSPNASGSFDIDIEMRASLLTPLPIQVVASPSMVPIPPTSAPVSAPKPPSSKKPKGAVEELADLKARLEADPTPKWMIVKDKMDHGPFAAIELLQQIVADTFTPEDELVDTETGARTKVIDHPEFSRFAHHANLKREEIRDAKAVAVAVKREQRAGAAKGVFGAVAVLAVVGVIGLVVWRIRGHAEDDAQAKGIEDSTSINAQGSVSAKTKAKPKYVGGGGGGGGGGGQSYESAMNSSVSDMDAESLSQAECNAPVNGSIAGNCGLSGTARAKIYVKNGRAAGVTVTTDPSQPGVESCMKGAISGLSWRSVAGGTGCIRTFKVN